MAVGFRPLGVVLHRPLWSDESWVAVLTRVPLSRMPGLASSSPVGWLALLRIVPGSNPQRFRFVTIAFAIAAVVVAYAFVRNLSWPTKPVARLAAAAAAVAVACVPAAVTRDDVKQYASDAFVALLLVALADRADGRPGLRALVWLGVIAVVAVPFSTTSAFVAVAVFGGLVVSAIAARRAARVRAIVAVGAGVAVAYAIYFAVFVLPNVQPSLRDYWHKAYLRGSPIDMFTAAWHRLQAIQPFLAMPAIVAIALFVVGIVALVRLGSNAAAAALPLLWVEMFLLGWARRYPFLELRTSLFAIVPSVVVIVVGAVAIVRAVAARNRRLALVTAAGMAALFLAGSAQWFFFAGIPNENVREQTREVAARVRPGDVVVVSDLASWGFAYYWPKGRIETHADAAATTGFLAEVRGIDAVNVHGGTQSAIEGALRAALDRARASGAGRVFVVRTHLLFDEPATWQRAFAALRLRPQRIGSGSEPLLVVAPD